jgi:hypothetical protein
MREISSDLYFSFTTATSILGFNIGFLRNVADENKNSFKDETISF